MIVDEIGAARSAMVLIHIWLCWQLLELVTDIVEADEIDCDTETKCVADAEAVGESAEVVRTSEPDEEGD